MAEWTYRITGIDSRVEFEKGDPTGILEVKYDAWGGAIFFDGIVEGHFPANLEDLTKDGIDEEKLRDDIHKSIQNTINKVHTWKQMKDRVILYHREAYKLHDKEFTHQPELRDKNYSTSLPIGFTADVPEVKEKEGSDS